jgi:CheY-like chemotaxis protein
LPERSILFVDDDPSILNGLRRMMHSFRQDFDLEFAGSGREALEILAKRPTDVIVSDMRMPGMTGPICSKKSMKNTRARCDSSSPDIPTAN